MRIQKTIAFVGWVMLSVYLVWAVSGLTQSRTSPESSVILKGKPDKSKLLLGQPLALGFELVNTGDAPVKVGVGGVDSGGLKIFISYNKGGYNEYFGRGWGRKRGRQATLEPGQSIKIASPTVLWNGKPNVSHLNENAAREVLAGKITTEYAFQEPGIYLLKGCYYSGPDGTPIESEPLRIEVIQPAGEDLEVWNRIKGNHDIAILMQNSEVDIEDSYAKRRLVEQVEQLVANHATSAYANYLRTSLEEFKSKEARRNALYKQ